MKTTGSTPLAHEGYANLHRDKSSSAQNSSHEENKCERRGANVN